MCEFGWFSEKRRVRGIPSLWRTRTPHQNDSLGVEAWLQFPMCVTQLKIANFAWAVIGLYNDINFVKFEEKYANQIWLWKFQSQFSRPCRKKTPPPHMAIFFENGSFRSFDWSKNKGCDVSGERKLPFEMHLVIGCFAPLSLSTTMVSVTHECPHSERSEHHTMRPWQ